MSTIIVFDEILLLMVNLISVSLSDILLYFVLANDGEYCVDFNIGFSTFATFQDRVDFKNGCRIGNACIDIVVYSC